MARSCDRGALRGGIRESRREYSQDDQGDVELIASEVQILLQTEDGGVGDVHSAKQRLVGITCRGTRETDRSRKASR